MYPEKCQYFIPNFEASRRDEARETCLLDFLDEEEPILGEANPGDFEGDVYVLQVLGFNVADGDLFDDKRDADLEV